MLQIEAITVSDYELPVDLIDTEITHELNRSEITELCKECCRLLVTYIEAGNKQCRDYLQKKLFLVLFNQV